jgi:hypothetical protein
MKPFYRKAVKDFKNLADGKFLKFGDKVTAAMTLNAKIFITPVPSLLMWMPNCLTSAT